MTSLRTSPAAGRSGDVLALAAELAARESWSRDRMLAFQREQVAALLRYAVDASPYYREALGKGAADLGLTELPTLPKATLMAEFDRIVTDPRLTLQGLERHLAGPDPAGRFLGEYHVFVTSGTTGIRGVVPFTEDEFAWWVAGVMRFVRRIGVGPETRVAAVGAPDPKHITKKLFARLGGGRSGMPAVSVVTPLPELLAALDDYRPDALIGYASQIGLLAAEQLDGRLRIEPRIVGVSAEVLTAETRDRIQRAWGVEPASVYASTEALCLAVGKPAAPLEIRDDQVVLEVVDEQNRPVPHGVPGHRVLVTSLVGRTLPLVRYELSDSVTTVSRPLGWRGPYGLIASVDGRSDDIIDLPAPGGGTTAVHPYMLHAPFSRFPWVRQYQVVHERAGLRARVVLEADAPDNAFDAVRLGIVAELERAGAVPPPVTVEAATMIEREPGPAAKLKLVKSGVSAETP